MTDLSRLGAALAYAAQGLRVFPVNGKAPLTPHGFKDASSDPETIRGWYSEWPSAGVAIPTGPENDLLVLDVDPRHGGEESLAELVAKNGPLPEGPVVATGGGGSHRYFRWPGGAVPTVHGFRPGLDLQAADAYVVAPPSPHPSGSTYRWAVALDGTHVPMVPPWILEAAESPEKKGPARRAGPTLTEDGGKVPHGGRHDWMVSTAASLASRLPGVGEDALCKAVRAACAEVMDFDLWPNVNEDIRTAAHTALEKFGKDAGSALAGAFDTTESGVSDRFIAAHPDDYRYDVHQGRWLKWTGCVWEGDDTGLVYRDARGTVNRLKREFADCADEDEAKKLLGLWRTCSTNTKLKAIVDGASYARGIRVLAEELDAHPWLLPVQNGVVDLRTGELSPSRREYLNTRVCDVEYDPAAEAPNWVAFLEKVQPDPQVRAFLQRAVGYTLTGDISEQVFFLNHGAGANGKSTFLDVVGEVVGPYSVTAHQTTFREGKDDLIPNDIAGMRGARLVRVSETGERWALNMELIKDLTGGTGGHSVVRARFLHREFFEFPWTAKLWLTGNHLPTIRGTDLGTWRRVRLVPWLVEIKEADRNLHFAEEVLLPELRGVLAWAVRGCLAWQKFGLSPPEKVLLATQEYRQDLDTLGTFIEDCCEADEGKTSAAGDLYTAWSRWCDGAGERPGSQKRFGMRLSDRGFESGRTKVGRFWKGLALTARGLELTAPKEDGPSGGRPRRPYVVPFEDSR